MTGSTPHWPNRAMAQPNPSTASSSTSVSRRCSSTATERGFAYAQDAPLDMRMDPTSPLTAADIVNTYDEAALADILRRYGEEQLARRIATHIVRRRARSPFTSTGELVEVALPSGSGAGPAHRWASGQAHVPGPAHRGQQRAGRVARRPPAGAGCADSRRAHRGDGLPVAGGPDRQAAVRRRQHVQHADRSTGRIAWACTEIHVADARRRTCRRRRDPAESAQCRRATACATTCADAAREGS